jgi:acylphosphatase
VGFRFFVRAQARELGVSGWVRNCVDGTVELEAQGPPDVISRFRAAVRQGPVSGRVDGYNEDEIPVRDNDDSFVIRA